MQEGARRIERTRFYERIGSQHMAPLWESLHTLLTPEPVSPVLAAHWPYEEVRQAIIEAGQLITAEEAERRVLMLENPGMPGGAAITRTLYAGIQLILPGETAPAHRHTPAALRFVLEGEGAFTAVNGERTTMRPGDLIITPNWAWHEHGNPSSGPMIWLDGLDIPLVTSLDAIFSEGGSAQQAEVHPLVSDVSARFDRGLLPVDWKSRELASPILNYPYVRTREALEAMAGASDPDPCHGHKLRYIDPATGHHAMPTMGAFIQTLPPGFNSASYRSSDSIVFVVVEGEGETHIGKQTYSWKAHDVFVVPPWTHVRHRSGGEAVLFSFSDRPVQEKLGLWREERGHA